MEKRNFNNEIYKPSIVRRIIAALIDLFFLGLLFLMLNEYVITPIFKNTTSMIENIQLYRDSLVQTNLYTRDSSNGIPYKITDLKSSLTENEYIEKLDNSLVSFYQLYNNENINIANYNQSKGDSNYFNYENDTYTKIDVVSNETIITFYEDEYEKAINLMNKYDDNIINLAYKVNRYNVITISISLFVSITLLYLVIPLIFKDGETLGKKLMGIGIVNLKNGFRIKLSQKIIRFLSFLIFEVILSILLLAIPLIISISMMFFSKNNMALHDQLAATLCIDKKISLVYKDIDEFKKHEGIILNDK